MSDGKTTAVLPLTFELDANSLKSSADVSALQNPPLDI
jgi:hypothetical protein